MLDYDALNESWNNVKKNQLDPSLKAMSMISENSSLENAKIEHDEKMMLAKTDASSMSELSNISDNKNSNNFYCERRELKFGAQGWHSSHAKLGKHKESSKGL